MHFWIEPWMSLWKHLNLTQTELKTYNGWTVYKHGNHSVANVTSMHRVAKSIRSRRRQGKKGPLLGASVSVTKWHIVVLAFTKMKMCLPNSSYFSQWIVFSRSSCVWFPVFIWNVTTGNKKAAHCPFDSTQWWPSVRIHDLESCKWVTVSRILKWTFTCGLEEAKPSNKGACERRGCTFHSHSSLTYWRVGVG